MPPSRAAVPLLHAGARPYVGAPARPRMPHPLRPAWRAARPLLLGLALAACGDDDASTGPVNVFGTYAVSPVLRR